MNYADYKKQYNQLSKKNGLTELEIKKLDELKRRMYFKGGWMNRSEVMKMAHRLKNVCTTFSECLKIAWAVFRYNRYEITHNYSLIIAQSEILIKIAA